MRISNFLKKAIVTVATIAVVSSTMFSSSVLAASKSVNYNLGDANITRFLSVDSAGTYATARTTCSNFKGTTGVLDTSIHYYAYNKSNPSQTVNWKYTNRKVLSGVYGYGYITASASTGYKMYKVTSTHAVTLKYSDGTDTSTRSLEMVYSY